MKTVISALSLVALLGLLSGCAAMDSGISQDINNSVIASGAEAPSISETGRTLS